MSARKRETDLSWWFEDFAEEGKGKPLLLLMCLGRGGGGVLDV